MLDTNIFNAILDGKCTIAPFSDVEALVTHIQKDEIERTPCSSRRSELLRTFQELPTRAVATETSVWNDTPWGGGAWSATRGLYGKMLADIQKLDAEKKKNKSAINQSRDARIAEAAIANQAILITNDATLVSVAREHGCEAMSLEVFQNSHG